MSETKSPRPSPHTPQEKREKWGNKLQFILSCVGYSVGLGNVWRFSVLAYEHGGGAFLIPYIICVFLAGLPLYVLELALGQFSSLGPTSVFRRLSPLFQGIGWSFVVVSYNISLCYNVIIAWILYYFFMSMRSELLWTHCRHDWTTFQCFSVIDDQECKKTNGPNGTFYNKTCLNDTEMDDASYNGTFLGYGPSFGQIARVNETLRNTMNYYKHQSSAEEFYRFFILDMPLNEKYGIEDGLGGMNWPLVGFLALAWLLVFLCLWGGVQTSGKVVYFTAIFPYVALFTMLIYGLTLDGAKDGIMYYITPNATYLLDVQTWRKAGVQVFYSLGMAQGGLTILASYNQFDNNFVRDALIVTVIDSMTSTIAGFATFSFIGYLAKTLGKGVKDAVKSGPGLAFVVFPQTCASLPAGPLWSIVFFFMLLTLGLDSQFVLFETATASVIDQFPKLRQHKAKVVAVGAFLSFLLGLVSCTRGGITPFTIFDDYSSGYVVMLLAVYEAMVVCWVYGVSQFFKDIERMRGKGTAIFRYYFGATWAVVTPVFMTVLYIYALIYYEPSAIFDKMTLPAGTNAFGWVLTSIPLLCILGFAIYRIVEVIRKKLPWDTLVKATPHWCPAVDLLKRSPARHEGSARLHLLSADQKNAGGPSDESSSSKLKSKEAESKTK